MDIRLWRRCWFMTGLTVKFSTLRAILVYQFFIASHDTIQKSFPFLQLKQLFTLETILLRNTIAHTCTLLYTLLHTIAHTWATLFLNISYGTQCPCFRNNSAAFKRSASIWHESPWSKTPILLLITYSVRQKRSLSSTSKSLPINTNLCMLFLTEHGRRKSQHEFCVIQLQMLLK